MKRRLVVIALIALLAASVAAAQEQTGQLEGRVADASGAVLPGVTVTLTGPTLLGGPRVDVTSAAGAYRLPNVPIGIYLVSFELAGFATKTYEGVRIQAGLTFGLNAELGVAGMEQTVNVVGESPILDTAQTKGSFTFTKELMSTVPNARDVWAIVTQAPGVTANAINVGGTQTGNQLSFRGHGVDPRQNTYVLDGANITDSQNNGSSQFYLDVESFAEVQLSVSSHNAEVQTPGMVVNIVPKSGTNTFTGDASAYVTGEDLAGNNVDDALRRRGVDVASALQRYYDVGVSLGGPIKRDKVWFFGAFRRQEVKNYVTGTRLADRSFPIDRTLLWYPGVKVNWQVANGHQVSGFYQTQQKARFKRGLSALRPVETTTDQKAKPLSRLQSYKWDWVVSDRMLLNTRVNLTDGGFELVAQPGVDVANTPAKQELSTGAYWDAPPNEFGVTETRRAVGATVSYFVPEWLGGRHEFKAGVDYRTERYFGNQGGGALTTYPANHRLLFFNGRPQEVILFAAGAQSILNPTWSAYGQDSWQLGRVRLNLGVRWDWQSNRHEESTAGKSPYFQEATKQPGTGNLMVWNTLSPRVGFVYDLFGDSKTLLKASYSRYVWQMWVDKGVLASAAGDRQTRHTWSDLNGDRLFSTNELGVLLSSSDPSTNPVRIDTNLKPTTTDELSLGGTRELASNFSVSGTFHYRKDKNLTWRVNPNLTAADYTKVAGRDPGPDGVLGTSDDGGAIDLYSIDAAKRGLSPNFITTWSGFDQEFLGVEVTLYRRLANNWQFVGSYTGGVQRENYAPGTLTLIGGSGLPTPQDVDKKNGTRIAESKPRVVKLMGSYALPHGFTLSTFYQHLSGDNFTREINSASAGVGTLNQGNIVALANERSRDSYDSLNVLDVRGAYEVKLGQTRSLQLAVDLFNVLNINTVTSQVLTSGSRYGQVVSFVPPRIVRFGTRFSF